MKHIIYEGGRQPLPPNIEQSALIESYREREVLTLARHAGITVDEARGVIFMADRRSRGVQE